MSFSEGAEDVTAEISTATEQMKIEEVAKADADAAAAAAKTVEAIAENEAEATGTDDGENSKTTGQVDPDSCLSATFKGPIWDMQKPIMYNYEEEYAVDGKVVDEQDKPDLDNKYTNIPARLFSLRGPGYLDSSQTNNTGLKVPSKSAAYACVGLNVFQAKQDLSHGAKNIGPLRKYLEEMAKYDKENGVVEGDAPTYLICNWNFSNFFKTEYTSVVHLGRRNIKIDSSETGQDAALDRAFSRFLALDDEQKNDKLKFAAIMRECNPQLKGAIDMLGGERPVLIGRRLTTKYYRGPNYLEVDMDVGSSNIASMLNSIALKSSGSFVVDESWCIEAQQEDELSERSLIAVRWNHCSLEKCRHMLDGVGELIDEE